MWPWRELNHILPYRLLDYVQIEQPKMSFFDLLVVLHLCIGRIVHGLKLLECKILMQNFYVWTAWNCKICLILKFSEMSFSLWIMAFQGPYANNLNKKTVPKVNVDHALLNCIMIIKSCTNLNGSCKIFEHRSDKLFQFHAKLP